MAKAQNGASTATASPTEALLTCSKCNGELDTAGSPRWCKKCRAEYQREWQLLTRDRAFMSGCTTMQAAIANYFRQYPSAMFSGSEIADMIRKLNSAELGTAIEFQR